MKMDNVEILEYKKSLFKSFLVIKVNDDFILFEFIKDFDKLVLYEISISQDRKRYPRISKDELNGLLFILNTNLIKLVDHLAKYMNKEVILKLRDNQFYAINGYY
jgi:hypothetical protein